MTEEEKRQNLTLYSIWGHKNGKNYVVLGLANQFPDMDRDEYPEMVVYSDHQEVLKWQDGASQQEPPLYAKSPDAFLRSRELIARGPHDNS